MFHGVQSNQRSCPAEPGFAVNGDSAFFLLDCVQELLDNVVFRSRTIQEVEIKMLDPCFHEFIFIVLRFIKSDY